MSRSGAGHTPPTIRNRVRRWYLVVQARRLLEAGYTQQDTAERLGITARSIRTWKADDELWTAAAVASDHEAVGPPKRTPSTALRALQDATEMLAKDRETLERRVCAPLKRPEQKALEDENDTATDGDAVSTRYEQPSEQPRRGRYVGLHGTDVGNRALLHEHDPAPLDVTGELAMTRAVLERVTLAIEADEGVDLDAVKIVARMLEQVSKMVHRIETIRAHDSISRKDFVRLMSEMGKAVRLYCTPEQARKISEHVMALRL